MNQDPQVLKKFLRQYEKWVLDVLTPTRANLRGILGELRKADQWRKYNPDAKQPIPSPIQRTLSRIKRPESVVDKVLRKPESFPDGLSVESIKKMTDALGARIITYFLSGIPIVHHELTHHPSIEISPVERPVAYADHRLLRRLGLNDLAVEQKDSGYSSFHYIARLKPHVLNGIECPWFEIQVRTLTLDTWSEIEHVLGYKPGKRTSFAVRKQFQLIANLLATIDEHFNFLFEEQSRYREEKRIEDNDPLNAENLPAILDKFGLTCAQHEIDGLLKLLASRGILTVKSLTDSATPEKIDIIRNTYRSHERRDPIDFEVLACIAATAQIRDTNSVQKLVEAQIDFLNTWEKLKKREAR